MTSWAWASRTSFVCTVTICDHWCKDWASWLDEHISNIQLQLMNCISSKFVGCFHNKQVPRSLKQFQVLSSDPFDRLLQEDFGFGKHLGRQEVSECWCHKMLFCILKDAYIMCIWMQIKVSKCVYMYTYILFACVFTYIVYCICIMYICMHLHLHHGLGGAVFPEIYNLHMFMYVLYSLRTLKIDMSPNFCTIFIYTQSCFFSNHFCGASSRLRTVSQDFMAECIRAWLMLCKQLPEDVAPATTAIVEVNSHAICWQEKQLWRRWRLRRLTATIQLGLSDLCIYIYLYIYVCIYIIYIYSWRWSLQCNNNG